MAASAERALWRAVIATALDDALAMPIGETRTSGDARFFGDPRNIEDAKRWLTEGGSDMQMVCALADVHPDDVRRRYSAQAPTDPVDGKRRRRGRHCFDGARAAELYAEGWSLREIGDHLGTRHVETVRQALLRQGVAMRPAHVRSPRGTSR